MKYDAIRRPPAGGPPKVIEHDLELDAALKLVNSRDADTMWPVGLARTVSHISRLVLLYGPDAKGVHVKSPGKQPIDNNWPNVALTIKDVERHVQAGGNVGMRAGDGLVILDFDDVQAEGEMMKTFGTLEPTVITGSGKRHYYFVAPKDGDMPAKIRWNGEVVGEVQRLRSQQVVCPPSVHPKSHASYIWANSAKNLEALPQKWVDALRASDRVRPAATSGPLPEYIKLDDERGHEADGTDWTGPDAEEIIRRALQQPGARRRAAGVKFQCPGCRDEGHDKHRDNAQVRNDGRWGCAVNENHRRAIGEAIGIRRDLPVQTVEDLPDQVVEHDWPDQTEEPPMRDQE